ncbi:MAG: flagellar biosynthetic protein FliO [Lachnospiraceae bacterium]
MFMIIGSTGWDSFVQLLVVLIIFVFVLAITALTTKWIGGYQKTQMSNKNMRVVESLRLGNNKFLALVEVGEIYLVVGVGKDEVHTIAKLTKDELPELLSFEETNVSNGVEGFQEILEKVKRKKDK